MLDQVAYASLPLHESKTFPTAAMPGKLLALVGPKADIKICLSTKRRVYSTLDRIEGTVVITPKNDLPFDSIDIEFVGTSRTFVERLAATAAVAGRSQAFHQFLRLSQPGTEEYYPENGILKAQQSYKFPFVFVVPQQLLPRICNHRVAHNGVHQAHIQLPPSLGDRDSEVNGHGFDDLAPEMASIRYGVYAKVSRNKIMGDELHRNTIVAKARKVRIIPAVEEQPPLTVDDNSDFVLRKEKKVRKGLLKGKLGTLVMEAQQPSSLRLPPADSESKERITTMATILLRFDPAEKNAQPPRLSTFNSKLKVSTFFATTARRDFPSRVEPFGEVSAGVHSTSLDLSSRCMANVDWTLVSSDQTSPASSPETTPARRSSSTVSGPFIPPEPSSTYTSGPYYVARLLVPIELPSTKDFVPTFHSCLSSRTYTLGLHLSTQTVGIGGGLDLRVPIQISSAGSADNASPRPSLSGESVEVDDGGSDVQSADDFFEPRTIHAPETEYVGGSRLAGATFRSATPRRDSVVAAHAPAASGLPEYSLVAPGATRRAIGVPAF